VKAALEFTSSKRGIASQDGSRQAETGIAWLCAQHEQPGPEGRRLIGSCWVVLVISEEIAVRNRPPALQEMMQIGVCPGRWHADLSRVGLMGGRLRPTTAPDVPFHLAVSATPPNSGTSMELHIDLREERHKVI